MQNNNHLELDRRVRETIAKTFRLSPAEAEGELRIGNPPKWDSLGHVQLLVALETEFGLTFPMSLMARLITVDAIIQAIQEHAPHQA
jgi:acyl carrier protein